MHTLSESLKSPIFNAGALFDIPTGKFMGTEMLNGGLPLTANFRPAGHRMGPNVNTVMKLRDILKKTAPNTTERYNVAINLLCYMGYQVKWEDPEKCPEVFWINTEGNGKEEAQMIEDILTKDYRQEA